MTPAPSARRPRRAARLLLLAALLSTVSIVGIEQVHEGQALAAGTAAASGHSAQTGHDPDGGHRTPSAGGQDGGRYGAPSSPVPSPASAVLAPHWVRDSVLALPVVLVGLVLAAAVARRLPGHRHRSAEVLLASRALCVAGALALASPAHALLFDEGDPSRVGVLRVLVLTLPLTFGTLVVVVAAEGGAALRRDAASRSSQRAVL